MRNFRRIDVLLDKETGERFDINDVVKIKKVGIWDMEFIGRLDWIETSELTLDMSKEYKYRKDTIKFEDISSIEKIQ